MHAMWLMIAVLCVLAIGYRFYSKFLATKVVVLDGSRPTPAYRMGDGQNYHPTNKWVLFGHHFAAISGAGPLIGPVLAAQFGYLPGLLWILIGVVLAGAVQDFVILAFSIRRNGKSLAQMAHQEISATAGWAATVGILFILIIALAGLGKVIVKALGGEEVKYPKGTVLVAPEGKTIAMEGGGVTVPGGTVIRYPAGVELTTGDTFILKLGANSVSDAALSTDARPPPLLADARGSITLAGEGVRRIHGSSWGVFTIALTIPIAMFIGVYMTKIRKGRILEASLIGGAMTLGAVWLGAFIDQPGSFLNPIQPWFDLSGNGIGITMAIYGFIAAVLPVWVLLCPRDYLSAFLKIGTIGLLVVGVILANPVLRAPAINHVFISGGPILGAGHGIFPFVFITIMCGAISGFHALVSSGTTPKMIENEMHARPIGYGAMLIEGLVGIVALIAATSLPNVHYYHMNTSWQTLPAYAQNIATIAAEEEAREDLKGQPSVPPLSEMEQQVGETLEGRTGGAVTLAVGMAQIFDGAAKNILGRTSDGVHALERLIPYWYHFAIMFEALFILTTIDAGTRVGRFLLQEVFGKVSPRWGRTDYWPSALVSTGLIVLGWWYFLSANSMDAIWPMFGICNQLLAVMALAIASVMIVKAGRGRYVWTTLVPMVFVTITTMTTAWILLRERIQKIANPGKLLAADITNAWMASIAIVAIVLCTCVILAGAVKRMGERPVIENGAGPFRGDEEMEPQMNADERR